jgi:hypothetical protein
MQRESFQRLYVIAQKEKSHSYFITYTPPFSSFVKAWEMQVELQVRCAQASYISPA